MKCLIFLILFSITKSENIFPWPETCYETCQDNEIQIVNMIEFDKDCEEEFKRFAPQAIYEDVACQWKNQVVLFTVRNLHFLSKNSTSISRENCRFFLVKNS